MTKVKTQSHIRETYTRGELLGWCDGARTTEDYEYIFYPASANNITELRARILKHDAAMVALLSAELENRAQG